MLGAVLLLSLFGASASAQPFEEAARQDAPSLKGGSSPSLEGAALQVRAGRRDLAIRADRWDTAFKLPAVEALLEDPLQAPETLGRWQASLAGARSLSGLAELGQELLNGPAEAPARPARPPDLSLPSPEAARAVAGILAAMTAAQPMVERAVSSLSPQERLLARETFQAMILSEDARRQEAAALAAAARFDQGSMLAAARMVAEAVERALPALRQSAPQMRGFSRRAFRNQVGGVLVCGPGDDVYSAEDLVGTALLVDFGGRSVYRSPAAAAGEGQQRVVIDLSSEVRVETSSAVSAGSGIFGIGLLYLPEPEGSKSLQAGDFSLGAGLFGVGGLYLRGKGLRVSGGRFTSGAGAFGLGLLYGEGDAAGFSADQAGQGYAFTRGAGLFALRGSGARLDCGLRYPDGREASAMLSLCQGVGQGPRAFAAGGVGLAYVRGDGSQLRSSYFAQGSGYWHGLGGLFLSGKGNSLQARRYSQGAGVHTAVGALLWQGDGNRLRNWGVGPAYGWDYGVGLLLGRGDGSSLSSDWGSARGDANGRGLLSVEGRGNRLALADFATGAFKRGAPSYGLAVVGGEDNRCQPAEPNAWGRALGPGLAPDAGLSPQAALWPAVEREPFASRDRERLQRRWVEAQALPLKPRLQAWLSILSDGGLDPSVPMQTAAVILGLEPGEGAALAGELDPARFDEYIWLRVFLPAFGRASAAAIRAELASSAGMRRALLLGALGHTRAEDAVEAAQSASADADWRVRRAAAGALGALFNREEGEEPGRLRLLEAGLAVCRSTTAAVSDAGLDKDVLGRIGAKNLWDLLSVLALDAQAPASRRVKVFLRAGSPFDRMGPGSEGIKEFVRALQERPQAYGPALQAELEQSARLEESGRAALLRALSDPDPEVRQVAVLALGQVGRQEDASRLAAFLDDDAALLREAAASALGKMGLAAQGEILRALGSAHSRTRALAALAAAQSGSAAVVPLLKRAFQDRDAGVRRTAVEALFALQSPWRGLRRDFLEELRRLGSADPDPQVRSVAGRAAAIAARD